MVKQCQLIFAQITVPNILTLLVFSLTLFLSRSLLLMLFDGLLDCVQVRLMVLDSLRVSDGDSRCLDQAIKPMMTSKFMASMIQKI